MAASRSYTTARFLRLVAAAALLAAGIILLAGSALSFETFAAQVNSVGSAPNESRYAEFREFVERARLVGVGSVIAFVLLLFSGSRLDPLLASVVASWTRWPRTAARRLAAAPRAGAMIDGFTLAAVIAIGTALRLVYLDVPLRYDEATTWMSYVSKPLYVGLSNYSAPNNHLLNTALAKLSAMALGDGPTALRLPALLASIAAIPAAYALGRMLYGRSAALCAAGLVAASSTLVEYSANARGYALVILFTLLALVAAARVVENNALEAWAAVTIALALGLYAVPTMLYAAGGVLLWISTSQLAIGCRAGRVLRRAGACGAWTAVVTLILYAPVLVVSGPRAVTSNEFVASLSLGDFLVRLPDHASETARTWTRDTPTPVAFALAALFVISLGMTPRLSRFRIPPFAALLVVGVVMMLAQRAVPYSRVWIFGAAVAAVTIAGLLGNLLDRVSPLGRARLGRAVSPAGAIIIALAGGAAILAADSPRTSRETGGLLDAPAVAHYLAGLSTPRDRILATGSDTILAYYMHRLGVDAERRIFTTTPRRHTYVVVNTRGNQTLDGVLADLGETRDRYGPAHLLRRWDSASLYVLVRR